MVKMIHKVALISVLVFVIALSACTPRSGDTNSDTKSDVQGSSSDNTGEQAGVPLGDEVAGLDNDFQDIDTSDLDAISDDLSDIDWSE